MLGNAGRDRGIFLRLWRLDYQSTAVGWPQAHSQPVSGKIFRIEECFEIVFPDYHETEQEFQHQRLLLY